MATQKQAWLWCEQRLTAGVSPDITEYFQSEFLIHTEHPEVSPSRQNNQVFAFYL